MEEFGKAKWIWTGKEGFENEIAEFCVNFSAKQASAAKLRISADSQYAAYLNGSRVAFGQYADFPHYKIFDEVDCSEFLREENRLCIVVQYYGRDTSTYFKGDAGLIFEIVSKGGTLCSSSADTLCRPSRAYESGSGVNIITNQLGVSYAYDAEKEDGWKEEADYSFTDWKRAEVSDRELPLFPRPTDRLALLAPAPAIIAAQGAFFEVSGKDPSAAARLQRSALSHIDMKELTGINAPAALPSACGIHFKAPYGDGTYIVIDLHEECAGLFCIDIELSAPARIEVGFGEHLQDLRVRSSVGGREFSLVYGAKAGRNTFTGELRRLGLRYLQLHVYAAEFTLYYAGVRPTEYRLKENKVEISDLLHSKIYETCVRTLKLCMHEHYEDSPWREQALYSLDSRNQMLFGYYAFSEYRFARASILLMAKSQRGDGLLELCAPARVPVNIPGFSLTFVIQLAEYGLFSGDTELCRELLPVCEGIFGFFAKYERGGLLAAPAGYWNFYEWADGMDDGWMSGNAEKSDAGRLDAPLAALYGLASSAMADMLGWLGEAERAAEWKERAKSVGAAANSAFWSEEKRAYASYLQGGKLSHFAQLTNALLVCLGAVPKERTADVLEGLIGRRDWVPVTLSTSVFLFDAVLGTDASLAPEMLGIIAEKWGKMLFSGATAFWETEDGSWAFDNAGSLCHAWSAVPIYIYLRHIHGLAPHSPGKMRKLPGMQELLGIEFTTVSEIEGGKN